jgi:hypothetical protein
MALSAQPAPSSKKVANGVQAKWTHWPYRNVQIALKPSGGGFDGGVQKSGRATPPDD